MMAPGILASHPNAPHTLASKQDDNNNDVPRDIFPDGIRTSGQIEPNYDLLHPYEDFPQKIEGPTVWRRDEFADSPEKWIHVFTSDEVEELGTVSESFIKQNIPLTGISKVCKYKHFEGVLANSVQRKTSLCRGCQDFLDLSVKTYSMAQASFSSKECPSMNGETKNPPSCVALCKTRI